MSQETTTQETTDQETTAQEAATHSQQGTISYAQMPPLHACLRDLIGYQKTIASIEASPATQEQEPLALYHHHPVIKKMLVMSQHLFEWVVEFENRLVEIEEDLDFEEEYQPAPNANAIQSAPAPSSEGIILSLEEMGTIISLLTAVYSSEGTPVDIQKMAFLMTCELFAKVNGCTVEEAAEIIAKS